jgi:hypothetical protein
VKKMKRSTTLLALAAATLASAAVHATPPASASSPLDRFKSLAGEWVAVEDNEMVKKGTVMARYAVTAGGHAVIETVFPGSSHEMVTVYTADGPDLVLTHYCTEGNQPRMRAKGATGDRVWFRFDGGAIDPARDRHMNSAVFEFAGPDELTSEWTELEGGKVVFVAKSHLARKAR